MKKIFRLLLLGLFAVSVSLPSVSDAAEVQPAPEAKTTIKKVIDGVGPLSVPYETEVTLDSNESFELTRKFVFMTLKNQDLPRVGFAASSEESAISGLTVSVPTCESIVPFEQYRSGTSNYLGETWYYQPKEPEIHDVLFKLTNYSLKPITYKVSIELTYGY